MQKVVIIGGGLGGLTAGALLAKKGYKVTLLEQHTMVGGAATNFKRGKYSCEVGLHEMDGAFSGTKKEIFTRLGVYDHLTFVRPREFFKVIGNDFEFTMPDSIKEAIEALITRYPKEHKGIRQYFTLIASVSEEFGNMGSLKWWQMLLFPWYLRNLLRYKNRSVKEVLDQMIENEELKLILNANVGYYNDTIKDLSFLMHAVAQYSYYSDGGWYIKGGSGKLSEYLASVITQHGGEVLTKAEVNAIISQNHQASTVRYTHQKVQKSLPCDLLISNISPMDTYIMATIPYHTDKKTASSLLSIYIGFKENLHTLYGEHPYSTFIMEGISSMEAYDNNVHGDITQRGFVFVDYSQIDSDLTEESRSFGVICTTDYLEDWEGLSKEAYQDKKQEILDSYLTRLERHFPNIQAYIAFAEVGTAKTMQHYLKTPRGTAYGFAPSAKQFFKMPEVRSKKLKNLYFTGAWVLGGGFTPAILSGALCFDQMHKQSSK